MTTKTTKPSPGFEEPILPVMECSIRLEHTFQHKLCSLSLISHTIAQLLGQPVDTELRKMNRQLN